MLEGRSDFSAIRGERAFSMAGALFASVPDFIQAHFNEAPRLDNVKVAPSSKSELLTDRTGQLTRWRALKRLAIQAHDIDRELDFNAQEIRSARIGSAWPIPVKISDSGEWLEASRSLASFLYGLVSDYGRSPTRPALFWLAGIVAGAVFYISQSPDMIAPREKMEKKGAWQVSAASAVAWHAWRRHPQNCYAGKAQPVESEEDYKKRNSAPNPAPYSPPPYIGPLSADLQHSTDLANEAWHLAFRNALILLDGSGEAAHRSYGCLYGVEMYGGSNPVAVAPSAVASVSAIQKLFSALTIFLFGLALRNMLKMK